MAEVTVVVEEFVVEKGRECCRETRTKKCKRIAVDTKAIFIILLINKK